MGWGEIAGCQRRNHARLWPVFASCLDETHLHALLKLLIRRLTHCVLVEVDLAAISSEEKTVTAPKPLEDETHNSTVRRKLTPFAVERAALTMLTELASSNVERIAHCLGDLPLGCVHRWLPVDDELVARNTNIQPNVRNASCHFLDHHATARQSGMNTLQ